MRQRFSELGGPTHPNFGMMVGLSSFLDKFVFVFRYSAAVEKYGAPKTTGVEIWAKIWDILPPCKKGGQHGSNVSRRFLRTTGGDTVRIVPAGAGWADSRQMMAKEKNKESTAAKYIGLPGEPPLDREA